MSEFSTIAKRISGIGKQVYLEWSDSKNVRIEDMVQFEYVLVLLYIAQLWTWRCCRLPD